jgi:hypothetical protein
MVPHPGQPLDDGGDALQGPQLADKPVGGGARQQRLLDLPELGIGDLRGRPGRAAAAQRLGAAALPGGMPQAHRLAGDAEPAGDLGLADAGSEQLGGAQPTGLQSFTFTSCRRAARDGWHARSSPAQQRGSNLLRVSSGALHHPDHACHRPPAEPGGVDRVSR